MGVVAHVTIYNTTDPSKNRETVQTLGAIAQDLRIRAPVDVSGKPFHKVTVAVGEVERATIDFHLLSFEDDGRLEEKLKRMAVSMCDCCAANRRTHCLPRKESIQPFAHNTALFSGCCPIPVLLTTACMPLLARCSCSPPLRWLTW